jgi:nicotinate-nucleotide adenylyltransferase
MYFVPARVPPHKKHSVRATASQRYDMLVRALQEFPRGRICTDELEREGPSYTVDTLTRFRQDYPDSRFYFIIGSDNLREIPTWHRYRDILAMVTLCVAKRPGYAMKPPSEVQDVSFISIPSPHWALSSTLLRDYLSQGLSCQYLLPDPVRAYIAHHAIY